METPELIIFASQAFIVLTTLVLVGNVLLKPMLKVIEERYNLTTGADEEVQIFKVEGEIAQKKYQEQIRNVREDALKIVEQHRDEAKQAERDIVGKAREKSTQFIENERNIISGSIQAVENKLSKDVDTLANTVVEKVMG